MPVRSIGQQWGILSVAVLFCLAACDDIGMVRSGSDDTAGETEAAGDEAVTAGVPDPDPYPSTYTPYPSQTTLITGARVLTGDGEAYDDGAVLIENGRISAVGAADAVGAPPAGARVIDAAGRTVTPGIIDIHSHLGVYPSPGLRSTSDGNEATSPNTAGVWAEHSVWPHDPGFTRALAGGITSLQILPGSANLFGGRSVTLKNVPGRTVQEMKFPGAPYGLKMACGENPKRVYQDRGPSTRMGNFRGYRQGWIEAADYKKKWDEYEAEIADDPDAEDLDAPARDLTLETLAAALSGDILIHMHCYRGDEMAQVLDLSEEFGYEIASFQHAIEAYKVADMLAERGICAAMWSDWWGFKFEAYDTVLENVAMVHARPGGCAIVHSDSDTDIQRLNQEAAKAMTDGNRFGLDIPRAEAIRWITENPARALGIVDETGTLAPGKMADVVIWSDDPFSVYAKADQVFVDGALLYDRSDETLSPLSDFELGQRGRAPYGGAGQ